MLTQIQQSWHKRVYTHQHEHWFNNLVEFHELTNTWLSELKVERPSHFISRGLPAEMSSQLWMLESLQNVQVDWLLDDTHPNDTLGRLEHTLWLTQSWTLQELLAKADEKKRAALIGFFEQSAWKRGRQCAAKRWPNMKNQLHSNLKTLVPLLSSTPMAKYPQPQPFLVKRALENELSIELNYCPHQSPHKEIQTTSDIQCSIHTQWLRGFVYELESTITAEKTSSNPRCTLRWFFLV